MDRIAVFAGSFDPVTNGHFDIVKRGSALFDQVIVGLGTNTSKRYFFSAKERLGMVEAVFESLPHVSVKEYSGLTTEFCMQQGARYLLRGVRTTIDLEYEKAIAEINKEIEPLLETVILLSSKEESAISSSIVKELIRNGANTKGFIPKEAMPWVEAKLASL